MEKKRIAYLDFIKVLAMFIVTVGHCAQALSCQAFPEKIIPNDLFVTIHMPLFMIASGFVLNFDKIRATPFKDYISNKFTRLIVPMIAWLAIYSIFTIRIPGINSIFTTYWYLAALFFSLITIRIFSSFIKNNTQLVIITLLFVLANPLSRTAHTNFMFPFLIFGYLLKHFINKMNVIYCMPFAIVFIILYALYWGIEHTVYFAPLDTPSINKEMIYSFLLRFTIGVTGSMFIFLLAKKFDHTQLIQKVSKYGQYTLVFYTMTTVINGFTRRLFSFIDFNISNPMLLDITSIFFASLQMYVIYKFAKTIEKNKLASKFLLGN